MKCPYCSTPDTRVVDSRADENDLSIKRRRICPNCQKKFTTYEYIERPTIYVVKKDGRRELFDPDKIKRGLIKACEKRPVAIEEIDRVVNKIKDSVESSMEKEIASTKIGEYIMQELKILDDIAHVRFASVYRQFKDINGFLDEINNYVKLQEEHNK
ncbi:MAG: transcriptional repressor NrdR [Clostridia bacterium]|nr:transcriptional repressor NrdR [Clostridia bacterium]